MIRESFLRAAEKPTSSGIDFLEAVLRERPDLQGQTAYFPEQGSASHVVFIGDEVFKGPKNEFYVPYFTREYQRQQQMEGKSAAVAQVTCIGRETIFFGMKRMPGVILGHDFCDRLTQDEQRALAKDIAGFIIDMAKAMPMRLNLYAVHDELHWKNILIDPETKRLTAVIDFEKMTYFSKNQLARYMACGTDDFKKMVEEEYALRVDELPEAKDAPSPVQASSKPLARL